MKLTKELEMEPVDVEEQFDNEILETKTPKTIHDLLTTVVTSKKTLKKAISVSTLLAVVCFVGVAVAGSANNTSSSSSSTLGMVSATTAQHQQQLGADAMNRGLYLDDDAGNSEDYYYDDYDYDGDGDDDDDDDEDDDDNDDDESDESESEDYDYGESEDYDYGDDEEEDRRLLNTAPVVPAAAATTTIDILN